MISQSSKWTCPHCNTTSVVNLSGVRQHLATCNRAAAAPTARDVTPPTVAGTAAESVNAAMDEAFRTDREEAASTKRASCGGGHIGPQRKKGKKTRRLMGTSVKGKGI